MEIRSTRASVVRASTVRTNEKDNKYTVLSPRYHWIIRSDYYPSARETDHYGQRYIITEIYRANSGIAHIIHRAVVSFEPFRLDGLPFYQPNKLQRLYGCSRCLCMNTQSYTAKHERHTDPSVCSILSACPQSLKIMVNIPLEMTLPSAHHSPNTVNRKASEFVTGIVKLSSVRFCKLSIQISDKDSCSSSYQLVRSRGKTTPFQMLVSHHVRLKSSFLTYTSCDIEQQRYRICRISK